MLELMLAAWAAFCVVAIIRIAHVGRINFRALDVAKDIATTGLSNGTITSQEQIDVLFDYATMPHFYTQVFDLTRWRLRDWYPVFAYWEAAHGR